MEFEIEQLQHELRELEQAKEQLSGASYRAAVEELWSDPQLKQLESEAANLEAEAELLEDERIRILIEARSLNLDCNIEGCYFEEVSYIPPTGRRPPPRRKRYRKTTDPLTLQRNELRHSVAMAKYRLDGKKTKYRFELVGLEYYKKECPEAIEKFKKDRARLRAEMEHLRQIIACRKQELEQVLSADLQRIRELANST